MTLLYRAEWREEGGGELLCGTAKNPVIFSGWHDFTRNLSLSPALCSLNNKNPEHFLSLISLSFSVSVLVCSSSATVRKQKPQRNAAVTLPPPPTPFSVVKSSPELFPVPLAEDRHPHPNDRSNPMAAFQTVSGEPSSPSPSPPQHGNSPLPPQPPSSYNSGARAALN